MAEQLYKIPLLGMTPQQLRDIAKSLGLPAFQGSQIAQWIYEKRATSFDQMNNLSKEARRKLNENYTIGLSEPIKVSTSSDGTVKYLFDAGEGNAVEAVYIPDDDRATLCISSQKGCKMGCTFCMTGRQGFHGNLRADQILNQIFSIPQSQSLTNIVFMGMGEPMDNLVEVIRAIEVLTSKWGLGWSPKRITVSSIGKLAELKRLIETTSVHIAISVHSPYHKQRLELMPVEKAYNIENVMAELRKYDFAHQRRLSVEYIMWDGVNDDALHADALAELIKGTSARVNLIRFHAIPGFPHRTSPEHKMIAFRDRLNDKGIICTIRRSRGEDIMAACGMLAGANKKQNQN